MNLDFRSLRIAFDAKRITHNATGLGNYGRTMVAMLARFAPQNRYDLYTPDPGRDELRRRLDGIPQLTFRYPRKPLHGPFKALWRSLGLSRELAPDTALFHGLSGELPSGLRKRGVRSVVTIHDLIFLRFPAYYKPVDRWIYTLKFRSACRRADRIIAISEATKRDVMHFFGIPEQKIDVIYQGCDERFKHPVDAALLDDVRRRHALPDHYILSVGSIEERKNLLLLLRRSKHIIHRKAFAPALKEMPFHCGHRNPPQRRNLLHRFPQLKQRIAGVGTGNLVAVFIGEPLTGTLFPGGRCSFFLPAAIGFSRLNGWLRRHRTAGIYYR